MAGDDDPWKNECALVGERVDAQVVVKREEGKEDRGMDRDGLGRMHVRTMEVSSVEMVAVPKGRFCQLLLQLACGNVLGAEKSWLPVDQGRLSPMLPDFAEWAEAPHATSARKASLRAGSAVHDACTLGAAAALSMDSQHRRLPGEVSAAFQGRA